MEHLDRYPPYTPNFVDTFFSDDNHNEGSTWPFNMDEVDSKDKGDCELLLNMIKFQKQKNDVIIQEMFASQIQLFLDSFDDDAISLICDKKLPALPIDDALKYGYYNLFQGIIPKYYSRNPNKSYEANWGLYRGRKVIPSALILLLIDRFIHNQKLQFIICKIQSLEKMIYKVLYKFN